MNRDIKGFISDTQDVKFLSDDELEFLSKTLSKEQVRRGFMRVGLDPGERLQFDVVVDMICERTGLGEDDALVLIRAHVPGPVRDES